MKTNKFLFLMLFLLFSIVSIYPQGISGNHYSNGVEGINAGSVPPPGFYLRWYNFYYYSSKMVDGNGDELPIGFTANAFVSAPRFIWITGKKFLGADVGFDLMLPIVNTSIEIDALGFDDSSLELADLYFSPIILSWHRKNWDATLVYSIFAPTGDYDKGDPTSAGKGYWTHMFSLGGTYYFDSEKKWSASILSRYEIHTNRKKDDVRPGDDFHFEWGISKRINTKLTLGLVGYSQFQITEDSGKDVVWDKSIKDHVHAIGGEALFFLPEKKWFISLRAVKEFAAKDRPEGFVFTLTLTKIF